MLRAMAQTQNKRRGAPVGRKAPEAVNVRGLTETDLAAVDRAIARRLRASAPGAQLSRNAVIVAVLREALSREDAADAAAPVEASP